jgi:enamine deaminase RidA (YjgF/YER057c/UK114 family)
MTKPAKVPSADVLHAPVGQYRHALIAPAGSDLLFISGQVGIGPDGKVAPGLAAQTEQVFRNIEAILRANGLSLENIVKMNAYLVAGQSLAEMRAARMKAMGDLKPCSTLVFVSALAIPELLIEIEAVAIASAA